MSVISYLPGSEIIPHTLQNVTVYETRNVSGIARMKLKDHAIFMPRTTSVSTETWEGKRLPKKVWEADSVAFLPRETELKSVAEHPFSELFFRISDQFFQKAATDHVDYSKIDFRFEDVTEKTTSLLAGSIGHMTMTRSFAHWPMLIEANALALVVAVICMLSPDANTAFREKPYGLSDFRMKRLVEFIDANLQRHITLAEMSDLCTVSPFHFSRLFKKRTGMTPMKFIGMRRIERAKVMLRSTGLTLAQIAHDCGFSSQSHLTGVFRLDTGSTPAAYRKAVG